MERFRFLFLVILGVCELTKTHGHDYIGTYGANEDSPIVPLVSGCGRAGTHTAGELLTSLGIQAIHEGAGANKVSVSWFFGANESFKDPSITYPLKGDPKKPVKLKNVDKLDSQLVRSGVRFHPIVQIVRHPLTHIETTSRCICAKGSRTDSERSFAWDVLSWQFAGTYIDLNEGCSALERSARYWLEWNEMIEQNPSTVARLRIEDLNPRTLVAALDLPHSNVKYDPTKLGAGNTATSPSLDFSSVPEQLAIHASASEEREVLEWATLQSAIGPDLSARIYKAALRYGYADLDDPSTTASLTSQADFADETRGPDRGRPVAVAKGDNAGRSQQLTSMGLGRVMGGYRGHGKQGGG